MTGAYRAVPEQRLSRYSAVAESLLNRRGVDRSAVGALTALKAMNIVQAALVLYFGRMASGWLSLETSALALISAAGAILVWTGWRRQRLVGWAVVLDVAAAVVVLVCAPLFRPAAPAQLWTDWPIFVTFLVAAEAGVYFRPPGAAVATLLVMAADFSWLGWSPPAATRSLVLGSLIPYAGFAVVTGGFLWYLRRLAELADTRAVTIRHLEEERTRRLLHTPYRLLNDLAGMLRREAARGGDDPERRARLAEAVASVREIESVVRGTEQASGNLADDLLRLREQFADLPLVMNVESAARDLPPPTVYRVREAVRSALQNVRQHAEAATVVVYATTDPTEWLVSIHDDGRGFDVNVRHGVGMRDLMIGALTDINASVSVDSAPGRGTFIEFKGDMG